MSLFSDELNGVLAIDSTALAVEYREKWFTWGDLRSAIDSVDELLSTARLGKDARIGVLLRNRPAPLAAMLAVIASERCLVTLNPLQPIDNLISDIRNLSLPVVIGEAEDWQRPQLLQTLQQCGSLVVDLMVDPLGARLLPGYVTKQSDAARLSEPGVAIEMLTSGTTGAAKRIPLKRQAFEDSFAGALFYERGRKPGDKPQLRKGVQLLSNPLTHIGGIYMALIAIVGGRRACLLDKFSVDEWHKAVVRHRPKVSSAVPAALRMILDANLPKDAMSSLVAIRTGTAPLDPAIVDEFLKRYDLPVLQNYGATEFAGAVAGWTLSGFRRFHKEKVGSVGQIHTDVEARIVDPESDVILPVGTEGILELRAPQLGDPKKWVRTTDLAVIDEHRFLWIRGRADNVIIRGGFKVHPDDVIRVIQEHPAVREASVVGVKDRRLGEVPVAALILKSNVEAPSIDEVIAFARARLLPYQVPVQFKVVSDLPRTPSMKPAAPLVRALFDYVPDPSTPAS